MRKFLMLLILISTLFFVSCYVEAIYVEVTVVRAKEALVEDNMLAVQEVVEAMSVDLLGSYPTTEGGIGGIEYELPHSFRNPFDSSEHPAETFVITAGASTFVHGLGIASYEGRVEYAHDGTAGEDDATSYTISGAGKDGRILEVILTTPGR